MFNECATSAFQPQGSDRYIGHWSLLPRRVTEPIHSSHSTNGYFPLEKWSAML